MTCRREEDALVGGLAKAIEAISFNNLGQGLGGNRSVGFRRFSGRLPRPRRLQEISERFQRRFGNVMLNPLGVGLGSFGRDTQRDKKIHNDPVTGSRSLGQRLSSVREKHSAIWPPG